VMDPGVLVGICNKCSQTMQNVQNGRYEGYNIDQNYFHYQCATRQDFPSFISDVINKIGVQSAKQQAIRSLGWTTFLGIRKVSSGELGLKGSIIGFILCLGLCTPIFIVKDFDFNQAIE